MNNATSKNLPLTDKICLVTGATAGIGLASATGLAALGATLVVAGRNPVKLQETVAQIQTETGNTSVFGLLADFSDLDQVRALAADFQKQYPRLDVLVNNAGAYFTKCLPTPYGVEMTFLINHLAPFLLTNLLLDSLSKSASARIVNVSSDAHRSGKINFSDLANKRGYFGFTAYSRSKLANILFTYELVRRLPGSSIAVNALHPGFVVSDLYRTNFPLLGPVIKFVARFIGLTPTEGADNTIYLASSSEAEGVTGKYFVKRQPAPSSPQSYDLDLARKLWVFSEKVF